MSRPQRCAHHPAEALRGDVCDVCLLELAATVPSGPDLKGERLGKYEIKHSLGHGSMGAVYLATDTVLERDAAIKILSADVDALGQLLREAKLAAALEPKHVVPVFDVGVQDGIAYLAMRYVAGGTLRTPAPSPAEAAATALTIARAVAHCHGHAILHRDLKPQNILVDSEGHHLVADFGLASHDGVAAGPLELRGTPTYMAPEVWSGAPGAASTMADVWSLGAILYELVSGRPPFEASSWDELRRRVAEDAPPPLRRCPSDLAAVCLHCLEKDPSRRYATAFELAKDLERFVDGELVEARSHLPGARWVRRAVRHPVISALVTLLVFVALYAGGATLSRVRAERNALNSQRTALEAAELTALSLAQVAALKFERYAAVVSAAGQAPLLAGALSEQASSKASEVCARILAEQGEAFSTWFVLDTNGTLLGRAPIRGAHATMGLSYAFRDYFRGAEALAKQHKGGVYVSHAYRSEGDDVHEIAISVPLAAGDQWLGVLVATLATGPALGSLRFDAPAQEDVTAALLAPRDPSRVETGGGPEPIYVILRRGLLPGHVDPAQANAEPLRGASSRAFERILPVANTPFSVLVRVAFDG